MALIVFQNGVCLHTICEPCWHVSALAIGGIALECCKTKVARYDWVALSKQLSCVSCLLHLCLAVILMLQLNPLVRKKAWLRAAIQGPKQPFIGAVKMVEQQLRVVQLHELAGAQARRPQYNKVCCYRGCAVSAETRLAMVLTRQQDQVDMGR